MKKPITATEQDESQFRPRLYGIILLVAAIGFSGLWLVGHIAAMDAARDNRQWQDKLNLIVESRATEVSGWLDTRFKELRSLADNPSLQLYLTELQLHPAAMGGEPAEKSYLGNLINFVAMRLGLTNNGQPIPANVEPTNPVGIAIVDNAGNNIVSTGMAPPQKGVFEKPIAAVRQGDQAFLDIANSNGALLAGFVLPIYSLQGNQDAQSQIGRLIAIVPIDEHFARLLQHPGVVEKTLDVALLREREGRVEYLTPLKDGSAPLQRSVPADESFWAESAMVQKHGGFESMLDYRQEAVFATSRPIPGTPWTILAKIDQKEALAESIVRRTGMIVMLLLALGVVVVTLIAVWRQSSLKRSRVISRRFKMLADRATAQEQLLRLVSDNQSEAVYIVDDEGMCRYANRKAGESFGMAADMVPGKKVNDVMGAFRAAKVLRACESALGRNAPVFEMRREHENTQVLRAEHIPLERIPILNVPEEMHGVLVVEQDVTELVHERERRMRDHARLGAALVSMVDKRDPHAAHHSAQVSFIARKLAESLQLDEAARETTRLAGSLLNIGKLAVSEQVLTREGGLNAEEKRSIREAVYAGADLLAELPLEWPVADTLRQSQEHWDGSGPKAMRAEEISLPARIVAVSNAFIGMISKRAWRDAMSQDAAIKELLAQAEKQYDRRVVVALADYIENKHGRAELEAFMQKAKKAA